jgi:nucleotide-binding universal stress UspA family protein
LPVHSSGVVVVGVDRSEVAKAALVFAAGEADRRGGRLVVAHAGDLPRREHSERKVEPFGEFLSREAISTVAAVAPHVDCRVEMRQADASDLLVELSIGADMLVVGTHRTGRLRGWVLGSVSQRVAAHARCPVVTISRAPTHEVGPVLLGASASPGGLAAARFACEEARVRGAEVRAVRAIRTEDWAVAGPGYATVMSYDALQHAAQTDLNKVLGMAEESYPEVSIVGEVAEAAPFAALLNASHHAAMLVIGSRRGETSPLPHLGPVAAWLLHQAQCPLAVVGHPSEDAPSRYAPNPS